ncbi:MAG: RNA polymerase sigma factor [Dehalococcoidia bacterium]
MAERRAASGLATASAGEEADFDAFYGRTSSRAYGLAVRIVSEPVRASKACEAAYARTWRGPSGAADLEPALLQHVREEALRLARADAAPAPGRSDRADPAYIEAAAVSRALEAVEPVGRRAVTLALFGGVGVATIAEIMGEPAAVVRQALRAALLSIGEVTRTEEETGT